MSANDQIKKHISTHSERSDDDRAAVIILESFLRSNGRLNTTFACDDKWPNIDGTFEYVSNPDISRIPEQNFVVQIKGTQSYKEQNGVIKYTLKSLAFPAYMYENVSADPGILFLVLDSKKRGSERVFWKYMSIDFLNSIDFSKESATLTFHPEEEIKNTDGSVYDFCLQIQKISEHHLFVKKLENRVYERSDVENIITTSSNEISECIDRLALYNETRDNVSKRILRRLYDLCASVLLLNTLNKGYKFANLSLAWEHSLLSTKTKYLGTFLKGLVYIGLRIPEEGQSERLMLKYYDFLWQIRNFLKKHFNISILLNLEKFPHEMDSIDQEYYDLIAREIESAEIKQHKHSAAEYYIQKKTPFFVGTERYYEMTLQLASAYATKFNRFTVYTKENISSSYPIRIEYDEIVIHLWEIPSKIKMITSWQVSITPRCLNQLAKVLQKHTSISRKYNEYAALMTFFTQTGMNLLELIDLQETYFNDIIEKIYATANTTYYKEILVLLKNNFSKNAQRSGKNVIRYLLLRLKEEDFEKVMIGQFARKLLCNDLLLSSRCFPFDKRPLLSNLAGTSSSNYSIPELVEIAGTKELDAMRPYVFLKNYTKRTGEIYYPECEFPENKSILLLNI